MRKMSYRAIQRLTSVGEAITIPQPLIEKLEPFGKHFVKVAKPVAGDSKSGKNAVEKEFQNNPYDADSPSLQEWLKQGNNYGVLAGDGIVIVETDTKEATDAMKDINTFTVQSGSGGCKRHFYILSNATENGVVNDNEGKNIANIQVERKFVVGPGCRHFSGGTYQIVNDAPLTFVSKQTLNRIFGVNLTWAHQRILEIEEQAEKENKEYDFTVPLEKIIDMSSMHYLGNGEYQGTHPIHDSTTGKNFDVNTKKNYWHCFRCNSGGGWLKWLAVKYGIIQCREAQPNIPLTGVKRIEALEKAREAGFDVKLPNEELDTDIQDYFEKDEETGRNKFIPAYLADKIMKERHFVTRAKDRRIFCYEPSDGTYKDNGDQMIEQEVVKKLGKHHSINRLRETYDLIRIKTTKNLPSLTGDYIAVKNGILNVQTRELKPFNPEYFVLNALPVTYDQSATCPIYLTFLEQVVPPKADRDGLQEFLGYILTPKCIYQKALMLIGVGANGKSTMLMVWSAMIGSKNISKVSLQELTIDRYALADLFGKMANICTDLLNIGIKDSGIFMRLTDGVEVSAQEKYKGRFDFLPTVKMAYATNDPPKPPKDIEAYFRRWLMVTFPNRFPVGGPKTDTNLLKKITTPEELSGILNWALDGLQRLTTNNTFTNSKTTEDTRRQYLMISDPEQMFVQKYLTEAMTAWQQAMETDRGDKIGVNCLEKGELYERFLAFCQSNNLPEISANMFSRRLPEFITVTSGHTEDARIWKGIRYKTDEEMKDAEE